MADDFNLDDDEEEEEDGCESLPDRAGGIEGFEGKDVGRWMDSG